MTVNMMDARHWERRSLTGGTAVVCETDRSRDSVSVGIWVNSGARDEPAHRTGAAHFVEHMVFKGTHTRSALDIATSLEKLGGVLEAFTTKEVTCFYARVLKEHLEPAVDVLCDLVSNPTFDGDEISRERGVILEELRSLDDNPDELINDMATAALWPDSPLGQQILGTEASLTAMDREDLVAFRNQHYCGSNTVLAAAGAADIESLTALVGPRLSLPQGEVKKHRTPPASNGARFVLERDASQLYLSFAAATGGRNHPHRRAVQLLAEILGGGMSSRLFQTIREDLGLAYSVYSYSEHFADAGIMGSILAVSPDQGAQAYERTKKEFSEFLQNGLQEGELQAAKAQVRGATIMGQESLSNRMFRLGRLELEEQRMVPIEESLAKYDAITEQEIMEAAQGVLNPEKMSFVAVGSTRASDWNASPVHALHGAIR